MEDWNEGDEQSRLRNLLLDAWVKQVTKEEATRAKSTHTVNMMFDKEHHKKVVNWARAKLAWDPKRQSLRNALLITMSGNRGKAVIWRLDESELGAQTICLQAIQARMSCDDVLDRVGEEVLKDYKNIAHNRGLQAGYHSVRQVGAGINAEAVMDLTGVEGGESLHDDDDKDEPAETAVCAFVANNLHKGSNRGSWNPLQQGGKKREKKEPRRLGDLPLSFGEFNRAHPQGCFHRRSSPFQHDHQTCPIHKVDTEAHKKAHRTKKCTSATIRGSKVKVSKDELPKLMMVGTELAKGIQTIRRA